MVVGYPVPYTSIEGHVTDLAGHVCRAEVESPAEVAVVALEESVDGSIINCSAYAT